MEINVYQEGSTAIASLRGDITHAVAGEMQERLLVALGQAAVLVLDFGSIGLLTSAGLRALLLLYREAMAGGKKLILAAVPEAIEDVMTVTGFRDQFVLCTSVDEAINQVSKSRKA